MNTFMTQLPIIVLLFAAVPSFADEPSLCSAPVIDNAHVLTSSATATITETLRNSLGEDFRDAHVMTMDWGWSAGSAQDQALAMIRQCSSWQDGNAAPKPALLLFAIAPSTQRANILYGAGLSSPLDGQWERIATTAMEPHLAKGEWMTGVDAGIQEVAELLRADSHGLAIAHAPVAPATAASTATGSSDSVWTDVTGLQNVLTTVVLPFAVVILITAGLRRLAGTGLFDDDSTNETDSTQIESADTQRTLNKLPAGRTSLQDFDDGLAMTSILRNLAEQNAHTGGSFHHSASSPQSRSRP